MTRYDTDGSGNLNADELTQLLAHYDNGVNAEWDEYHTGRVMKNIGSVTPTSEEIELLLRAASKQQKSSVDASELSFVLDLWHSYVMNRKGIEEVFEQFDTDNSKKLDFDQLKGYLTQINEGHAVKVLPFDRTLGTDTPPHLRSHCSLITSGSPPRAASSRCAPLLPSPPHYIPSRPQPHW